MKARNRVNPVSSNKHKRIAGANAINVESHVALLTFLAVSLSLVQNSRSRRLSQATSDDNAQHQQGCRSEQQTPNTWTDA
ncbi:hypothetical protein PoB_005502900 [Plakobranchus ocellatus]|uniref:Uncharacterized protein n=1 Tax=Plakobranchus ocellatus TaxID=259542 RepID=A0AAV4CBP3_9GAST|nr:hypothetical protein PoB_005502900 [Plakobranchus ocellatus]